MSSTGSETPPSEISDYREDTEYAWQIVSAYDFSDVVGWRRFSSVKRQMHNWAFREFQELLAYKAAEYGIRVEQIPLEFTS
jgi:transposase